MLTASANRLHDLKPNSGVLSMEKTEKSSGRRGFVLGMLATAGATSAALLTTHSAKAKEKSFNDEIKENPILYRRTEEAERYYKTLYT